MALGVDPWALANRQRNPEQANRNADAALQRALADLYSQQASWAEPRENYSPMRPYAPQQQTYQRQGQWGGGQVWGANDPVRYGLTPENQYNEFWNWRPPNTHINDYYAQEQKYRDDHNRMIAQSQVDWAQRRGRWDATKGKYGQPDESAAAMNSPGVLEYLSRGGRSSGSSGLDVNYNPVPSPTVLDHQKYGNWGA